MRLLYDVPVPTSPALAVVRSIVRANQQIDPLDALYLAQEAIGAARAHRLDPNFFASALLQESGFAPGALSKAGAVGIAQFTLGTAADEGVDPFDWRDAMRGSARLFGRYVRAYDAVYADPYAAALAAYDAGPGNVAAYRGVPPFPETRQYVGDVYFRWARLLVDERRTGRGPPHPSRYHIRF